MSLRRSNGDFDYAGFSSMVALGMSMLGAMYAIAVRPIEHDVLENKAAIKVNTDVARRVELTTTRVDVLVNKQNDTLNRLAISLDKLADKIDRTAHERN